MGEEADDYDFDILGGGGVSEHERVMEWETGLPGADELTPLSQSLVPPGLAAAFRIPPEPGRTLLDVHHSSAATVVPKTIMQLMNVEGLTRENVASHLQKYRLYVKRMQGLSNEGPSPSDHIFASTPVPQSLHEPQAQVPVPVPMPAAAMYHPVPMGMVPMNGHAVYSNGYGHGVSYPQYHHRDR